MRNLFIAAAALAAFPAVAQAQTAATPLDHSGLRVEGIVGYDALTSGEDSDGVVYGGTVGYDFPAGGVTLGADAELTDSSIKGTEGNVLVAGDSAQVRLGRDIYVGGRVGFPLSPQAQIYAKGGYTNARINTRYTSGTTAIRENVDADGYRLGAGIEHKIGQRAYLKGEYRYSNYKEIEDFDIDADRHQVVAGVGIRF